jgi:peroxiredoxin
VKRSTGFAFIAGGLLLIAAAVFTLQGSSSAADTAGNGEIPVAPEKGAFAPDFSLKSVSGETVHLSDFQGKVVLVNFWAVWCPPCRQEMPAIQNVHENYGDQVVVLAVNAGDTRQDAAAFMEELGLTFDVVLDSDLEIEERYRVRGLPSTFFIDPEGIIQIQHIGFMEESLLMGYLADMGVKE